MCPSIHYKDVILQIHVRIATRSHCQTERIPCLNREIDVMFEYGCHTCYSSVGVRFSVRPTACPSVHTSVRFTLRRPQHLRPFKRLSLWNHGYRASEWESVWSRWQPVLKIAKSMKSSFSPERLGIFGWNFSRIIVETLVFKISKWKKIRSGIRSQWHFHNLRRPKQNVRQP